ncbi:neuronal acetylcholine receptor subunit alpha-7-like [Porites lutea]|uniref:neuronal acetylcholine receptor subunit alpha-7-like n=1 Tax=Porites lutea TaxID=51062 RepID=UPI003CC693F2
MVGNPMVCELRRVSGSSNGSSEHLIRAKLLENYDKIVLPVTGKKMDVRFNLRIVKLLKDTIAETIAVDAWMSQTWTNEFLQWNASEFGNENTIHFWPDEVWTPDISLLNNAEDDDSAKGKIGFGTEVKVLSTGLCILNGMTTLTASCQLNLEDWPFDNQTCVFMFGSYTYGTDRMTLQQPPARRYEEMLSDRFLSNGNWDLQDIQISTATTDHENCCHTNFSEIVYTLKIARRPLYYLFYLVGPCIILLFLNLTSFLIPVESGERIGFVTTILLAMIVFLLLMSSLLPETSSFVPKLGINLMVTMVIMCMVLLSNILVLKLFFMEDHPPKWLQRLFCFFQRKNRKRDAQIQDVSSANGTHLPGVESPGSSHQAIQNLEHLQGSKKVDKRSEEKVEELTWQKVSIKLDNVFFFLFSLIAVITYAVIFM